jgi:nucleoside phosphorylase
MIDERTYSYDLFISYRWVTPDQEWVRRCLHPALVNAGLKVLLDVEDFVPGRDLILEMERAGLESRHVLCVLSPEYFEEGRMVAFESLSARRRDPSGMHSFLIPLVFRDAEIPERIRGLIPIDWTKAENREREWRKLLQVLNAPNTDAPPPGSEAPCATTTPDSGRADVEAKSAPRKQERVSAVEESDRPIDFAIITAIEVEREAVCKAFGLTERHRVRRGARVYWRGRFGLTGGDSYEVVVAQSPDMANVDAALLTSDTIRDWQPGSTLMVGIAASGNRDVALGDVVVGSHVYYYERGKVTPGGVRPEPYMYPADSTLWANVAALPPWTSRINAQRPDHAKRRPKVHYGSIASGEKVIADAAARDSIVSAHRKILAIEMEGYGFSKAVWQSFERVRHLVIRAICDDGSPAKSDEWQAYAAAAAASYAKHFLRDTPLPPRRAPPTDAPARRRQDNVVKTPTTGASLQFWNGTPVGSSRIHERAANGDPTVLIVLVHGITGSPHRTWGNLPRSILKGVGSDADVISYAGSAPPQYKNVVEEAAAGLRRLILSRPQSYMHIFFLAHREGGFIVRELLAKDVESAERKTAGALYQLPAIAGRVRAVFNFTASLRDSGEGAAYGAELGGRLRRALDVMRENDFPRPRFVEFVPDEELHSAPASEPLPGHGDLVEVVGEGNEQTLSKTGSRRDGPRLGTVVARMRPYFNSPDMVVAYVTLRRLVGLDGGISPTLDAAEVESAEDRLARNDWVGWHGSQQFTLRSLAELSSPRQVRAHPRILITGSAGVGKSTVLRRHGRYAATRYLERQAAAQLCMFIPLQNITLDPGPLQEMQSGTGRNRWRLLSHYYSTLVKEILLDPQEENALADDTASKNTKLWQSACALLTPEWAEGRPYAGPVKIILDGVDEFIVNNPPLTVETISQLLRAFEEPSQNDRIQWLLAARSTLPAVAELSRHRDDAYEISPLSEEAAEELFPGTRSLLSGLRDESLRRLLLSPLVLVRLGPYASRMTHGALNSRSAILRHAIEALIEQSQLPRLGEHSAKGFPLDEWTQALALAAWVLYRDNRGSVTVPELLDAVQKLKVLWSSDVNPTSHGFAEGLVIFENASTLKALLSRTVLNSFGKESVRFTHREWLDFLVSDYLAQCVIGQVFSELDFRAFSKQIYGDVGEVLWQAMSKAGVTIDNSWLSSALADDPFARPYSLMNICALLGNGPVDVDQIAFRRLTDLISDPRCLEATRIVAVSSFCMRLLRSDERDRSMRYMSAELVEALDEIVRQGLSPHRKVTASMAWCYRAELWRRHPHLRRDDGGEWPALSAMTESGVAAARESGIVWKQNGNTIYRDVRCLSFQIAAAQYPHTVRGLSHEEISLTHYLFLACAALRAGAAATEIFPLLRAVFAEESGVAERVRQFALPEVQVLFESCRQAAQSVLGAETTPQR